MTVPTPQVFEVGSIFLLRSSSHFNLKLDVTMSTNKPLFYFSFFLWFGVIILLFAGGLVTSKEAGLAVPDWPLSYGQFFPPMVGNIAFEHGHRMIAGTIGILTLILTCWVTKSEKRSWLKKLTWFALLAVVVQALLGGITVLTLLPWQVSSMHATLGQIFFCLITAITYFLSPVFLRSRTLTGESLPKLKKISVLTAVFILLQLMLGAVARHTNHMHVVLTHIVWAVVVLVHIILVCVRGFKLGPENLSKTGNAPLLAPTLKALAILTGVQIVLGFGALYYTQLVERGYAPTTPEVLFTAFHQTTGALILAMSVLTSIIVKRKPLPA